MPEVTANGPAANVTLDVQPAKVVPAAEPVAPPEVKANPKEAPPPKPAPAVEEETPDEGGLGADSALLEHLFVALDKEGRKRLHKSWFNSLVEAYLRHRNATKKPLLIENGTEGDRALEIIRAACIKASITGAAAGVLTTSATVVTAESVGWLAFLAVPAAAIGIGGEMFYRAVIHLEMTCDLAELFGVPFDSEDSGELWRVYALAFNTHDHDEENPGNELVHKVAEAEGEQVGEKIGGKLMGESLLRNVLPFVGIATSSIQNWRMTKKLGDTVRRYVRYQRALRDALERDERACHGHLDTLVEGLWFIFTADGHLAEEEAATLAHLYDNFEPTQKAELLLRFIADEAGFLERCRNLPKPVRAPFLHAMEVAAAVDKEFSLPEQKLLERVAKALDVHFSPGKVHKLMEEFEEKGVLHGAHHVVSPHPGAPGQHPPVPTPA